MEKICDNCKWYREDNKHVGFCMNPLNDKLYDHFNSSTGDMVVNLRRAAATFPEHTCDLFEAPSKKGTQK
jgi:hypothetical protein